MTGRMSDNPADSLRRELGAAVVATQRRIGTTDMTWQLTRDELVPGLLPPIEAALEAARADARAQAFTEAAAAVQAERMPDPPTEEMRSRVDYWRGYDAAIFDAGEAVRGLGEETENARERR